MGRYTYTVLEVWGWMSIQGTGSKNKTAKISEWQIRKEKTIKVRADPNTICNFNDESFQKREKSDTKIKKEIRDRAPKKSTITKRLIWDVS